MKKTLALLALALPLLATAMQAQDSFDFRTLDKLRLNAKNSNVITLDGDMLKMAAGMLGMAGNGADSIKPLVDSLKGIYIRSYEFDKEGQYSEADLEPLRGYLKQFKWTQIVESREGKETSEIYLLPGPNNRLSGVAIIAADAKELTVVYINGNLRQEDIEKLSGTMGIPDFKGELEKKGVIKPEGAKPEKGKKEDEE